MGRTSRPAARDTAVECAAILAQLERAASPKIRAEMGPRYGIHTTNALGVRMSTMHQIAKPYAGSHALALALWKSGGYEARTVAAFVEDPAQVTPAQMDRWARDFDNWGICDTACFHLFDRTPHAFAKIAQWAKRREEFVRRAGFALLASLALHDKTSPDARFRAFLPLAERGASDDRNFVKKGVSWGLRGVGRRSPSLRAATIALARRLAESDEASARWVGRDVLRDLEKTK